MTKPSAQGFLSRPQKTPWILAPAVVLAGIAVLGCGQSGGPNKNATGKLRIASLASSTTEVLFKLGMGGSLVGVTDYCDYPPEAKRIERVGGFGAPNVEKLLALNPNLVIAAGVERGEVIEVLRRSNIRVVDARIGNFKELFDSIRQIGLATDMSNTAEGLVLKMQAELRAVADGWTATPNQRRPKVFVEISDKPLTTAGGTSFLDDVIVKAGGVNVAHEISAPYPCVNPEKVIEWDPQVVVIACMGDPRAAAKRLPQRIGWAGISAVREGRIVDDICPDLLLRPGPRLIDGVKALSAHLHEAGRSARDK
jgi:iron complex transport system substrate-binding protein